MNRNKLALAPLSTVLFLSMLCGFMTTDTVAFAQKAGARPSTAGPTIGGNSATPIDRITVAEGFKVELLYSVPAQE